MKNKKSCFPFTVWDMTKSKKKCETFKDISLLITSSGASIIGLLGFKKSGYLIAIALALTVVEIFLVIRINRVLKNCEESANKEVLNGQTRFYPAKNTAMREWDGRVQYHFR